VSGTPLRESLVREWKGKTTMQKRTRSRPAFATRLMAAMMTAIPGDDSADANQTRGYALNSPGLIS
jgi:hypothetical protein